MIPRRTVRRPMILWWLAVPVLACLLCRVDVIATYTTGAMSSSFGSGFAPGAIGWHKWLRNLLDLPLKLLLVGPGLPACLFIPAGVAPCGSCATRGAHGFQCLPLLVLP